MNYYQLQFQSPWVRYGFAFAMVAISILSRYAVMPLLGPGYQYVTVFPVVMIVALLAGRGPAILNSILSGVIATYLFTEVLNFPAYSGTVIVILTGILAGGIAQRLRDALTQSQQYSAAQAQSEMRYRAALDELRAIMDATPGGICVSKDPECHIITANKPAHEMFGVPMDENISSTPKYGKTESAYYRIYHNGKELTGPEMPMQTAAATGKDVNDVELEVVRRDGTRRVLLINAAPMRSSDGVITGSVGAFTDITERKQAEEALKASEAKFRAVFEHTALGMGRVRFDDARWADVNDAFCHMLGRSREEMLATAWPEITYAEDIDLDLIPFKRMANGELESYSVEKRFLHKQGHLVWARLTLSLVRDAAGKPDYEIAVIEDITPGKQAQEALRQSESFYRQTLESIPGMVFTTQPDGYCDYQSRQWVEYTGVAMEQMLGDGWNKLLHPDDQLRAYAAWRAAVDERAPYDLEYRVRRHDGVYEWFKVHGHPIRDADGKIVRWFGVAANINDLKQIEEALDASRQHLSKVLDSVIAFVGVMSLDGKVIQVNRPSLEIAHLSPEDVLGKPLWNCYWFNYDPQIQNQLIRAVKLAANGVVVRSDMKIMVADGKFITVDLAFAPMRGEDGQIKYIIPSAVDITDRKRAEDELRASEQQFRKAIERAPIPIIMHAEDGQILQISRKLTELTGYTMADIPDVNSWVQLSAVKDIQEVWSRINNVFDKGTSINEVERQIKTRTGEIREWAISSSTTGRLTDGRRFAIAMSVDLTERKRAQEALRNSRTLLAEAEKLSHTGAWQWDVLSDKWTFSDEWLRIHGCQSSTMSSDQLLTIAHPDDREKIAHSFKEARNGIWPYELEHRIKRLDNGKERIVRALGHFLKDASGNVVKVYGFVQDITEQKKAQQQLLAYKEQLESKNKELETIIGIVSHDLRSPLVNVKGFVNEIKKDCILVKETLEREQSCRSALQKLLPLFEESLPESAFFIDSSATAMSRLVESLVKVARAGLAEVKPEYLDMKSLAQEAAANLEFKAKEKKAEIEIESLPECYSDKTQTIQIISNLIDNAIKYLDPQRPGNIRVSGVTRDQNSIYCVSDNGVGIPQDKLDKIFEIGYRLKQELASGEGLGLAMVKRMIDRNSGRIWVDSRPGKGSKFYISLPRSRKE